MLIILLGLSRLVCAQLDAHALGWQSHRDDICEGYFIEPNLNPNHETILPLEQATTIIHFDKSAMPLHKTSVLIGHVAISQPNRLLRADNAYLTPEENNTKPYLLDLYGHVQLREPGSLFLGQRAHFLIKKHQGYLLQSSYHLSLHQPVIQSFTDDRLLKINNRVGWGVAPKIEQINKGVFRFYDASYSTCNPLKPSWVIVSKQLELNQNTGLGEAHHVTLKFADIPIFYSPYLSFPLDERRKSGFLSPKIGINSDDSVDVQLPYYLNLAPNYDLLITPRILSARGVVWQSQYRFLSEQIHGSLIASGLTHDNKFKQFRNDIFGQQLINPQYLDRLLRSSDNRGAISLQTQLYDKPHWLIDINYNWASDDYYLADIAAGSQLPLLSTIAYNTLPQTLIASYQNAHNLFKAGLLTYQTLQPVNQAAAAIPYNRLPDASWDFNYDLAKNWHTKLNWQYVQFRQGLSQPGTFTVPPAADRLHLQPEIYYTYRRAAGYITPTWRWYGTHYHIYHQLPGRPDFITRSLPMLSVDSGLYFDRTSTIAHQMFTQTLEPRAYYVFVPYHNQINIPIIESAYFNYDYNSLFAPNRFSGIDRIGDTNRLSLGVLTRIYDHNHLEKLTAGIGEIFRFTQNRVTSCAAIGCTELAQLPRAATAGVTASVIAGVMTYRLTNRSSLSSSATWDPESHQFDTAALVFHYQQSEQKILDINYSFGRNALYQYFPNVDQLRSANAQMLRAAAAWPLTPKWQAVATWARNISQNYLQDYLVGIEYNTCCWAARVVAGKVYSALNADLSVRYDRHIYFQWQLKGLTTIGNNNPVTLLQQNIPGFHSGLE